MLAAVCREGSLLEAWAGLQSGWELTRGCPGVPLPLRAQDAGCLLSGLSPALHPCWHQHRSLSLCVGTEAPLPGPVPQGMSGTRPVEGPGVDSTWEHRKPRSPSLLRAESSVSLTKLAFLGGGSKVAKEWEADALGYSEHHVHRPK